MNFNSIEYFVFLPVIAALSYFVQKFPRVQHFALLVASYYFYMSWDWRYAGLIAASTLIDYLIGWGLNLIYEIRLRKLLLLTSLTFNLGLLCLFKYFNFFIDVGNSVLAEFGYSSHPFHLNVLLPVGISFYTFQTLSYTVDLYHRKIEHERSLLRFSLFVSFFPQLVAGPIVRASDFLPQLTGTSTVVRESFDRGLFRIAKGLFKKVLIADLLAYLIVDPVFANPESFSSVSLYLALVAYAFQIYGDFSGYSDIAIGSAELLGFKLPENFNRPYLASNMREFWSRWHISLSTWLRDYLYIPMGGNRLGASRTAINLMVTMVLGGLWHGAGLNFIMWGLFHGMLLVLTHWFVPRKSQSTTVRLWFNRLLCFHTVLFGWLLFRVSSLAHGKAYVRGLLAGGIEIEFSSFAIGILLLAILLHLVPRVWTGWLRDNFVSMPAPIQATCYLFLVLALVGGSVGTPAFIYFQF